MKKKSSVRAAPKGAGRRVAAAPVAPTTSRRLKLTNKNSDTVAEGDRMYDASAAHRWFDKWITVPTAAEFAHNAAHEREVKRLALPKARGDFATSAPAAVASSMARRFDIRGSLTDAVRCTVREPYCSVVKPPQNIQPLATGTYGAILGPGSTDGVNVNPVYRYVDALSPRGLPFYYPITATTWAVGIGFSLGEQLQLMALMFSRYCVKKMRLCYEPTCPTDTAGRFVLCVTDDPSHPVFGVTEFTNANYPNFESIENCSNAVNFAAWSRWSAEFPCDGALRYTAVNGEYAGNTSTVVYDSAALRHTNFGSLVLLTDKAAALGVDIPDKVGFLYWELDIEFFDPAPVTAVAPIPLLLQQATENSKSFRASEESKASASAPPAPKKEDDDDDDKYDRVIDAGHFPRPSPLPSPARPPLPPTPVTKR